MNKYIKICFVILLLIFSQKMGAGIQVNIKYTGDNPSVPKLTRKIINKNFKRYKNFIGLDQDLNMLCLIARNNKEFIEYLGHETPKWLAGVMDYRENRIVLKSPKFKSISHEQYENTIKHELVHFIQNAVVPLSITPNWFDEGIAEYLAKNYNIHSQIILSRALNQEKLISIKELNVAITPNRTKNQLAYAESASLIDFLLIAYGEEVIQTIFNHLKKGSTFSRAWSSATGMEYQYLDFHWRKYLKKRYKWIFLLDFKYLIWLIMPVLLVIGYIIKKITNREIINEWEEESEKQENKVDPAQEFLETPDHIDLPDKYD
ncbi:MAG: hypothetical protein K9M80_00590 [Candidatus Marinimicrobia bacterium]|nr:hypothetical protein [Candidatus Neomarinimicrobiota bacterium]